MEKDVMIAIMMSLVNYIIVNTINSASSQKTENYFKKSLDDINANLIDSLITMRTSILNEIKEQSDRTRELLKETAERIEE